MRKTSVTSHTKIQSTYNNSYEIITLCLVLLYIENILTSNIR